MAVEDLLGGDLLQRRQGTQQVLHGSFLPTDHLS